MCMRKIDQFTVNAFLASDEMPLEFHENIFAPECVNQKFGAMRRIPGSARVSRAGEGVFAIANFSGRAKFMASCESFKRSFRPAGATSTRSTCAHRAEAR